ncbi:MAG: HTH domain-containing protein [Rudanella sp.]|nr:HTH domain-containing protein [Rudanella sp.]
MSATESARRFSVSTCTIYRDIRTLERAGIPLVTQEGKGYAMLNGYRLPPVMFSGGHQGVHQWMTVLYLMNLNVSMAQVAAELDISEMTAQRMCAAIREGRFAGAVAKKTCSCP